MSYSYQANLEEMETIKTRPGPTVILVEKLKTGSKESDAKMAFPNPMDAKYEPTNVVSGVSRLNFITDENAKVSLSMTMKPESKQQMIDGAADSSGKAYGTITIKVFKYETGQDPGKGKYYEALTLEDMPFTIDGGGKGIDDNENESHYASHTNPDAVDVDVTLLPSKRFEYKYAASSSYKGADKVGQDS